MLSKDNEEWSAELLEQIFWIFPWAECETRRQAGIQLGPKWPLHLPEPGHQPLNDFILKTKLPRAWGTEPVHKNIFLVCDHCAMCFEYSSIRQVAKIRSVVSLVSSRSYALLFSNEV